MAELYSDLYSEVRLACGDFGVMKGSSVDTNSYVYRDDMIDSALTWVLYDDEDYDKTTGASSITPDFADDIDRQVVVLSAALWLLTMEREGYLSMGGVRLQESLPENQMNLVAFKLGQALERKDPAYVWDGSTEMILNLSTRWSNQLAGATQ